MPKVYSEKERIAIRQELQKNAEKCLSLYGIKKSTVDEIVKMSKIPKGTFYLFYPSKEVLLFEVILKWHDEIQNEFLNIIKSEKELSVDLLTDALCNILYDVENKGLAKILTSGDIDVLVRKLPEDMVNEHLSHDDEAIEQLFSLMPTKGNIQDFSAAFRAVFFTLLYKEEIGENFKQAHRLLVRGLILQFMEG